MTHRSLLSVLVAGSALVAGAAYAADIPIYEPPPVEPMAAPQFDWTGFYVGIHGGFGGDRFEYPFHFDLDRCPVEGECTEVLDLDGKADLTSSGFFAGGQAGFNWQVTPNIVLGVEGDIAWSDIKGELGFELNGDGEQVDPFNISAEAGSEVEWFGTGRLRLGWLATPQFMVYGTGGVAFGEVTSFFDIHAESEGEDPFDISDSTSDTEIGWTAGAGAEYKVTDRISLKTEYLYVDLGDQTLFDDCIICGDLEDNLSIESETHFHTIKVGLNWHF